jgi:transmembrane sensor
VEIGRSRRRAQLRYGRARFRIAPASEPFVVETASSTITARQGVIDVEQVGHQGRVQVLAGAAEVRGSDQEQTSRVALGAGESVTVNPGGSERKSAVPSAPDWTRGMLQFDGTTLADAVALANRYSERHIVLVGDLKGLRVTGAFRAGDMAGLAKALAAAFTLALEQRADGTLVLSRSASPALQNKRGG